MGKVKGKGKVEYKRRGERALENTGQGHILTEIRGGASMTRNVLHFLRISTDGNPWAGCRKHSRHTCQAPIWGDLHRWR